jgi:hypothetical protein
MPPSIQIKILTGHDAELAARMNDVARLRITVFREFPYLYDGNFDYEKKYLASYTPLM